MIFFDLKGIIENLYSLLHIEPISFSPSHLHNFHPNRQAAIVCQDNIIGSFGELHPKHSSALGIEQRVYFAEINIEELTPFIKQAPLVKSLISPSGAHFWCDGLSEPEVPRAGPKYTSAFLLRGSNFVLQKLQYDFLRLQIVSSIFISSSLARI